MAERDRKSDQDDGIAVARYHGIMRQQAQGLDQRLSDAVEGYP